MKGPYRLLYVCKNWKEQRPEHPGKEHIPHATCCSSKWGCWWAAGSAGRTRWAASCLCSSFPVCICHVQGMAGGHTSLVWRAALELPAADYVNIPNVSNRGQMHDPSRTRDVHSYSLFWQKGKLHETSSLSTHLSAAFLWRHLLAPPPGRGPCRQFLQPLAFTKGLTGADLPAVPLSFCTPLHSLENASVPGVVCHQSHSHIPLGKQIVDSLAFQEYWAIICCFCLTIDRHFISISELGLAAVCFPLVVISPKWRRRTRAVQ